MRGSLTTIILLLISPIQAAASIALMLLANPIRKKLIDEAVSYTHLTLPTNREV